MPCVWLGGVQPSSAFDIALWVIGTVTRSYVRVHSSAAPLHVGGLSVFAAPRAHVCGNALGGVTGVDGEGEEESLEHAASDAKAIDTITGASARLRRSRARTVSRGGSGCAVRLEDREDAVEALEDLGGAGEGIAEGERNLIGHGHGHVETRGRSGSGRDRKSVV